MTKTKILEKTNDSSINIALDTISRGKQAIIFVNTKRSAESIAEKIAAKLVVTPEGTKISDDAIKALATPTKQCQRLGLVLKKGIAFHHSGLVGEQRKIVEDNFKSGTIKIIAATPTLAIGLDLPAFRVIIRDLKRYGLWGMEYIPVLEYEQQSGRAGRPSYDTYGEAIILATSENEKKELLDKYINGFPEEIISKLASEPIMRTYILSLIASGFVNDVKELENFFSKTFYAKQFGDLKKLNKIIAKIIEQLREWEFLKNNNEDDNIKEENIKHNIKNNTDENSSSNKHNKKSNNKAVFKEINFVSALKISFNQKLESTLTGNRVSELYLDPYTANYLISRMHDINKIINNKTTNDKDIINSKIIDNKKIIEKNIDNTHRLDKENDLEKKYSVLTILHVLCSCLELRPLLRVKTAEYDTIEEYHNEMSDFIIDDVKPFADEYDEFLAAVKTAKFFMEWLDEKDEEFLLEQYDVRPGEIYGKIERIDWLLYACIELSRLTSNISLIKELNKLRLRIKYGVKEELLPLLQLKNIGKVRARTLFRNNIKDISDVKKIDFSNLAQMIGKNVAVDIKKQVGQDFSEEKVKVKENKRKGQISLNDY